MLGRLAWITPSKPSTGVQTVLGLSAQRAVSSPWLSFLNSRLAPFAAERQLSGGVIQVQKIEGEEHSCPSCLHPSPPVAG
jgi:hypothetical protein